MSEDPIGDALRADAEAAREEIREAGIVCPSCGLNLGDLYGKGHRYDDCDEAGVPRCFHDLAGGVLKCAQGKPVPASAVTYEMFKAAANIALMDEFWQRENEAFGALLGGGKT